MAFIKAKESAGSKKDGIGTVRVKVILQDPNLQPGYPVGGNLKYEVALENTSVSAVQAVIERALFGDDDNPKPGGDQLGS